MSFFPWLKQPNQQIKELEKDNNDILKKRQRDWFLDHIGVKIIQREGVDEASQSPSAHK